MSGQFFTIHTYLPLLLCSSCSFNNPSKLIIQQIYCLDIASTFYISLWACCQKYLKIANTDKSTFLIISLFHSQVWSTPHMSSSRTNEDKLPCSNRSWGHAICIFCMFVSMHLVCAFRYHICMYIVHEFCINCAHYGMGICASCSAQTGHKTAKHKDRQWRNQHTNVKTENIRFVYKWWAFHPCSSLLFPSYFQGMNDRDPKSDRHWVIISPWFFLMASPSIMYYEHRSSLRATLPDWWWWLEWCYWWWWLWKW